MSSDTTQGQRVTAPFNRLREAVILAFLLFAGSAIGFPHLFLIGSSSVLQGIAIASTLLFIASSGFLITTHPHPARTASVVGAIVVLGGAIVGCCALIAPGIQLAITVGIVYTSAWIFVAATFAATTVSQLDHSNRMLVSKQVLWSGIGLLGFLWLAITLFSSYGLMAVFWFVCVPLIPYSVWQSCAYISKERKNYNHYRCYNLALALLVLGVVITASGKTLNQEGAIVWTVQIIILAFAILTASLLNICVTQVHGDHFNPTGYKFYSLLLILILAPGILGYSDHFWKGITLSERLNSLGSAAFLDKILVTHLWNQKITISSDEQFLANGGEDSTGSKGEIVQLWDLKTGKLTRTFSGYSDPSIVANSSNQPILLMRSPRGNIEQWSLSNLQHQQGNDQDKKLLWQQPTRQHQTSLPQFLPRDAVLLSVSVDGKTLATGFDKKPMRNRILIWDTLSGKLLYSLSPGSSSISPGGYYGSVTFSPSGHLLANDPSGMSNTGNIHIWRLPRY